MIENRQEIYTYNWMHTPTGAMGRATKTHAELIMSYHATMPAKDKLLFMLNIWNRLGNGVWVYWI